MNLKRCFWGRITQNFFFFNISQITKLFWLECDFSSLSLSLFFFFLWSLSTSSLSSIYERVKKGWRPPPSFFFYYYYPLSSSDIKSSSTSSLHFAREVARRTSPTTKHNSFFFVALPHNTNNNGFSPVHVRVSRRQEQRLFEGVLIIQENVVEKGLDHDARDGIHGRR